MPYITPEAIKEKRVQLRKLFPKFKLSVTGRHHSVINVSIMSGPLPFPTDMLKNDNEQYTSVNHFYINENYKNEPKWKKVLNTINEIITKEQRELVYDGDYGSVPTYYVNINIGKWDREYVQTTKK